MAVPRFVWNIFLAAISLGLAWGGREQLEAIIANFLLLLGYWTICFGTILAIEHFWFRRQLGGYDYESWQEQDRMPLGIAGCISLLLGIGASFLGMVQTWVRAFIFFSTILLPVTCNANISITSLSVRLLNRSGLLVAILEITSHWLRFA